jgi:hypothetical protein
MPAPCPSTVPLSIHSCLPELPADHWLKEGLCSFVAGVAGVRLVDERRRRGCPPTDGGRGVVGPLLAALALCAVPALRCYAVLSSALLTRVRIPRSAI